MPFTCNIDPNNFSYEFKSTIERSLANNTMGDWLHHIIDLLKEIKADYSDTITTQQQIAGQARHSLTEKLDQLFNGLLVLQRMMHENIPEQLNRSLELKPRVSILYTQSAFHSTGTIREQDLNSVSNLAQSLNDKLLPTIKELLVKYKRFADPQTNATLADFQATFHVFDEIFYQLLIFRFNLVDKMLNI